MKNSKPVFIFGTLWEILRFFLFFSMIIVIFNEKTTLYRFEILWFLILSAAQLIIPGCYLLLIFFPDKYRVILQPLRMGKILNLLCSVLFIIDGLFSDQTIKLRLDLPFASIPYLILILGTVFFDLIFLYFLLSYKIGTNGNDKGLVIKEEVVDIEKTDIYDVYKDTKYH
ncbi:MAG: hypothetical protein JW969_07845 [Spirochaetales bacterium]|nr:hypothetical protein [Spirochaetales bacterium]